ncbi:MAG: RNA-guided endonuclease InsQ/TnpB family protein [Candidatus Wukongarchaeota archaeon]|nr:transposase [Candidatus Wukongarchaeota archaeon]
MELTKTVVLKLRETDNSLDKTLEKYAEGMNFASKVVYENKKPLSANKLQKITYKHLREKIGLKSQMSCNVARQVAGAYKTLQKQLKEGKTRWQQIKFKPTNITFSYRRDFSINKKEVSITTLDGRKKYKIANYRYAEKYFDSSWKYLASKLVKQKDDSYYFHLSCWKEMIEEPDITKASNFMGVDVGINYLAVATTTDKKKNRFFSGGEIKNIRNIFSKQREMLQKKGTRSAKRVLKHLSGREKRFMRCVNHVVSKKVVAFAKENKVSVIGLEDLKGIRDRARVRKKQRYRHNSWAFRQLQNFIEYKALEQGIGVVYVDAKYTSQTCSRCGHINKNNRNGLNFLCKTCGCGLNADLNGARNIEHRTRDFRHVLESQGCVVNHPYGNGYCLAEFQAPSEREG